MILRDRDANTDFDAEADGTLEERTYYHQNWRADVIALVEADGSPIQLVRYDTHGVPFGIPKSDMFGDGSVDTNDYFEFASLYGASNVRAAGLPAPPSSQRKRARLHIGLQSTQMPIQ